MSMSALNIFIRPCKLTRIIYNGMTRSMSTVNIKDVEHHTGMKHSWWEENGPMKVLHCFNPLRVQFVRDGLVNTGFKEQTPSLPLQGVKMLDIGCGGGILTEALARTGAEVTGIDPSKELINIAKEHAKLDPDISKNINYVCSSIENFSSTNEKLYDVLVCSEVIEHVTNKELFIKENVKLLKPGGSIFITTPNKTLLFWFAGIIVAEYITNMIPRGTHDWNNFITINELQRLLENNGCKTKLIHGIMFNPIKMQWSWSSNLAFCYAFHAVKQKETDM